MPKRTSLTDRRGHGVGDNTGTKVTAKANLQDQRKKGAYAPKPPAATTSSEFAAGAAAGLGRTPATQGKPPARTTGKAPKLGAGHG
jgi:hypothetical protein